MKCLVTTTINKPTKALNKFIEKEWHDFMVIVGDLKTPHDEYHELVKSHKNIEYLDPESQDKLYPQLSELIGWNCIQRRSLGFIRAYQLGAEIMATVDDDNIPYENWSDNITVNSEIEYDSYKALNVFDPISVTNEKHLWHRGFPIQLTSERELTSHEGRKTRKVLVQADLWDGDPDIDAIQRIAIGPECKFDVQQFYGSDQISPFNSQNTFLARETLPWYMMLPGVGRMDDIWASFFVQREFPDSLVYGPATVYQARNEQNLLINLKDEMLGYEHNQEILSDLSRLESYLPKRTLDCLNSYQEYF